MLLLVCFAACGGKEEGRVREGLNGTYYGGVLNVNESEELLGLFPLQITHVAAQRIGAQIFEGLVRFDLTDLSVKPGLAESWTVDPTGTVYTFKLRDDVSFHDDPCFPGSKGREVEADDVIACFTRLCTLMPGNEMFWLFQDRVLGANAQMAASVKGEALPGVSGLERVNDRTVRITLVSPWPGFLHVLAHHGCWIWPVEALERYGADVAWHPVGTGPFKVKSFRRGEALVLERNPEYWRTDAAGNRLPFLDAVRYTFLQDKDREYAEFAKGHLDLVLEPPLKNDATREDTDQVQVMSIPGFSVQYYAFNTRIPPFNDPLVRRAISLAIDRRALVDTVLGGQAVAAERGVVPPGFVGYPYDTVPPLVHAPDSARRLLASAGYPGGEGLPTLYLHVNNGGFGYIRVAGAVQAMLERELGLHVASTVLPTEQHFESVERGAAAFWREGWVADHPDPENFLAMYYGKNAPLEDTSRATLNSTRYRDPVFDAHFAKALRLTEGPERMRELALAERRLMQDMVVVPLYHQRVMQLAWPHVRGLTINGLETLDLAAVWFDPAVKVRR